MAYRLFDQETYGLADQGALPLSETPTTDDIFGYRLFLEDATSEIMVVWVDERTGADGAQQTLRYGTGPQNLDQSISATGDQVPSRSEYIYSVKLASLSPDTKYYLRVDAGSVIRDLTPHTTFPTALPTEGIKFVMMSDIHITQSDGVTTPGELNPVAAEEATALFMAGDLADSFKEDFGSANGAVWIDLLKNFLPVVDLPIFHAPGNHDVGNHQWDGTGSVNPDQNYYRIFFPNTAEMAPAGTNYGQVAFGNYFQMIGLDTHSARPIDQRTWLEQNINTEVSAAFAIYHCPMLGVTPRDTNNLELQVRNGFYRAMRQASNLPASYAGHVHYRTRTVGLGISESDPGTSESEQLFDADGNPDGWMVAEAGGHVEFGQGWRSGRGVSAGSQWFLEESQDDNQYYLLTLTAQSLSVEEKEAGGTTLDTTTFTLDTEDTVTRTGTVTRDGNTVAGADVVFITRADLLANATAQATTDASGEYSAEIPTGEEMVGIALEGADGDSTPFTEGS